MSHFSGVIFMEKFDGLNQQMVERFAPASGRRPLLHPLSDKAQVALMCRMLFREGWNEHITGDIMTLDAQGNIIDGDWNITPAIGLHIQLHALQPKNTVVIHNHAHWSGIWANMHRVPSIYDQTGAHCGVELPLYNEYAGTFENMATSLTAAQALGHSKWALLANHGSLVVGKDLRQALLRVITLEMSLQVTPLNNVGAEISGFDINADITESV
jgi:L-fuculose-phosphate aldolase